MQLAIDGHDAAVDLCAGHPVAHGGMDGIGKIDGRRPLGQVNDVAPGGEHIDLVSKQVGLDIFDEIGGVGVLLALYKLADPGKGLLLLGAPQAVFVFPVGGDAVFRLAVHLLGADLHLKGDALGADDHRVQRLVAVGLGGADIVLEAAGHRLVQVVDHAQHVVTVGQLLDDDPGGADVIQLGKAEVLSVQLPVDAVDALEPGLYLALDAGLLQLFGDAGLGQVQKVREAVVLLLQIVRNLLVAHRVQDLQRPVLQLPLDPLHTQPVGQGGVDLHGLHGDVPLLLLPLELDGAHIVQAVGQLDHDDPDVLRHGDEHLAQVLHLLLFLGGITGVLHLSQLGDAVH